MTRRIGVCSLVQETNTFSPLVSGIADFERQGLLEGEAVRELAGTNAEAAGAIEALERRGATAVPLLRGWAMSSGRLAAAALAELQARLGRRIETGRPLDGLVLSLHGALAAEGDDDADLALVASARRALGAGAPIGVCLDLHANVTRRLVDASAFVIGYHTYPHVDQAATGARCADLLLDLVEGRRRPMTRLAKRPMLIAPEGQGPEGPLGVLRAAADAATRGAILDVSLFPVQPWLDVAELGFGVTVTADADPDGAAELAERLAAEAWAARDRFQVELVAPRVALERVREEPRRPVLLSESADSPTSGAAGDSPAMVRALLEHAPDLRAYVTLVDPDAVGRCWAAGRGAPVALTVGCGLDRRFHRPVPLAGRVAGLGQGPYHLTGPAFRGMAVSMGRWAVVESGRLAVLLTEHPACTFDPETFRQAGLAPERADVIVVRSATLFRAGFAGVADRWMVLDLPGASTPRLATLAFARAPRPLHPVDPVDG